MRARVGVVVIVLICCVSIPSGCSQPKLEDPAETVQVRGSVAYKGRPVPGAQVLFHRDAAGESAFGLTDQKGEFVGMTNDTTGVFPGNYRVTVTHPQVKLPKQYADADLTPLEVVVEKDEAEQKFPLELTD